MTNMANKQLLVRN